jgi:catechol 2,3-dioxygenase-like lactoylglutathione lyase family enzyme
MPIDAFQHINIRSADVEAAREFYVRILGLRVGDRPPFASTGYWLYLGDDPLVHLVQRPAGETGSGSGAMDHLAFRGVDLDSTRRMLTAAAIPFREAVIPRDGNRQIFIHDPDGVQIELNFPSVSA